MDVDIIKRTRYIWIGSEGTCWSERDRKRVYFSAEIYSNKTSLDPLTKMCHPSSVIRLGDLIRIFLPVLA